MPDGLLLRKIQKYFFENRWKKHIQKICGRGVDEPSVHHHLLRATSCQLHVIVSPKSHPLLPHWTMMVWRESHLNGCWQNGFSQRIRLWSCKSSQQNGTKFYNFKMLTLSRHSNGHIQRKTHHIFCDPNVVKNSQDVRVIVSMSLSVCVW